MLIQSGRKKQHSLNISYDFKNSMVGKNGDLDVALGFSNVHQNMASLPAGGRYPKNNQIIQSLDMSTKIDLLRSGNNAMLNDDYQREVIHQSITNDFPMKLKHSSRDLHMESELMSMPSNEGIFFQPDLLKAETREGKLKIQVNRTRQNPLSPFMPSTKGTYASPSETAPATGSREARQQVQ